MSRLASSLVAGAALAASLTVAPHAAAATDPAQLRVTNGSSECWGRTHATLWHFLVFNDGGTAGRYRVDYRREADDELSTYTRRAPKHGGMNDGLVIPAGASIDYVKVTDAATASTLFVRSGVTGLARCSA